MKRPFLTRLWVYGAAISTGLALNIVLNSGGSIDVDDLERTNVPVEEQVESLSALFNAVSERHYTQPNVESLKDKARECAPEQETVAGTLDCVLRSLDAHSYYMSPIRYEQEVEQSSGVNNYVGIGIGIGLDEESGYVKINEVFDDGPAKAAGLKKDDLVTHLNGESAHNFTLKQFVNVVKGEAGTDVEVTIVREGQSINFILERTPILVENKPVVAKQIGDNIGYVHLSTFSQHNSNESVREAVQELRDQMGDNFDGLILDLRGNLGGFVKEAHDIADDFLDSGQTFNLGRTAQGADNTRSYAEEGDILDGLPLVVLVNERSASASELLSGAFQDHDRATIIGTRTFGKGSAQKNFSLSNGGVIHLTTRLFFLPSGRSIQNVGVVPDIRVVTDESENRQATEANREHALNNPNGQTSVSESSYTCDAHTDMKADDIEAVFRTGNGRPDEALICAVEYLNGSANHVTFEDRAEALPKQRQPKR